MRLSQNDFNIQSREPIPALPHCSACLVIDKENYVDHSILSVHRIAVVMLGSLAIWISLPFDLAMPLTICCLGSLLLSDPIKKTQMFAPIRTVTYCSPFTRMTKRVHPVTVMPARHFPTNRYRAPVGTGERTDRASCNGRSILSAKFSNRAPIGTGERTGNTPPLRQKRYNSFLPNQRAPVKTKTRTSREMPRCPRTENSPMQKKRDVSDRDKPLRAQVGRR